MKATAASAARAMANNERRPTVRGVDGSAGSCLSRADSEMSHIHAKLAAVDWREHIWSVLQV